MLGYQLFLSLTHRAEGESLASALMSLYPTLAFPLPMSARRALGSARLLWGHMLAPHGVSAALFHSIQWPVAAQLLTQLAARQAAGHSLNLEELSFE